MSSIAWNGKSFFYFDLSRRRKGEIWAIGVFAIAEVYWCIEMRIFDSKSDFFFNFYTTFNSFMTKTCCHGEFGQWQDIFFAFKIPKLRTLQFQVFWKEIWREIPKKKNRRRIPGMWRKLGWSRPSHRAFDNTNKFCTFSAFSTDFDKWSGVRSCTSHQVLL